MPPIDYRASISTVLGEIASPDGSLGSGAATAVVLSIGLECLALALELSVRHDVDADQGDYRRALRSRLDVWRSRTARAFVDDPAHFGLVIDARRRRDAAREVEKATHVKRELEALAAATGVLIDLAEVSIGMEEDSRAMLRSRGVLHAAGEAATARSLSLAATEALLAMTESNILTVHRRMDRYGLGDYWLNPFRDLSARLPSGAAKNRIEAMLERPAPGEV